MMQVLDGKIIAKEIKASAAAETELLRQSGMIPTLAIVVATEDPSSLWYVSSLQKAGQACGLDVRLVTLATTADTAVITQTLHELGDDDSVHGIILQTPLPAAVVLDDVLDFIPATKDVDGANPLSAGNLMYGTPGFAPATAAAVMEILNHYDIDVAGKQVVVVGRSRVVGKPVAHLLLERDATVTICHKLTDNLAQHTRAADVLVVAVGKAGLITPDMVKPGAQIIDVGTNVTADGKLVGDVDPAVADIAGGLSPVPGGVGPVTTALLIHHTVQAAKTFA